MQIGFSAAFGRANHQGILYKLCSVGRGCSVFYIGTVSMRDHSTLWWMVVGVNG